MQNSGNLWDVFIEPPPAARKRKKKRKPKWKRALKVEQRSHRSPAYKAYMKSERWKLFRFNVIAKRGSMCERCGKFGPVDAHHITYERLGHELPGDVKLYCRSCHDLMHLRTK